ncbi:T6SS effector amidase Tae4 family protein [Massilia aquatica]
MLRANYPAKTHVSKDELYGSIGHEKLAKDFNWDNTCAVRVSLALIASGVRVPGHMRVNAGRYKGRLFQPGQAKLSDFLARPTVLGKPEIYTTSVSALMAVRGRTGIISFFGLLGGTDTQGHIDIVFPGGDYADPTCGNSCYWSSNTVWFWPIK